MHTVVYVINRIPSSILENKSPFEVAYGSAPNYANFKPFGCRVYPYLRDYSPHKLAPHSRPCIFLGYSSSYKGFRCYDPDSSKIYVSRHAQFDEQNFPFSGIVSQLTVDKLDVSSFLDTAFDRGFQQHSPQPPLHASMPDSNSHMPCRSCLDHDNELVPVTPSHPHIELTPPASGPPSPLVEVAPPAAPQPSHPMVTRAKAGIFKPHYPVDLASTALLSALASSSEPRGFKSATKHPHWLSAMQEEMDALRANQTWDLVPCPSDTNIVGSKWVYR